MWLRNRRVAWNGAGALNNINLMFGICTVSMLLVQLQLQLLTRYIGYYNFYQLTATRLKTSQHFMQVACSWFGGSNYFYLTWSPQLTNMRFDFLLFKTSKLGKLICNIDYLVCREQEICLLSMYLTFIYLIIVDYSILCFFRVTIGLLFLNITKYMVRFKHNNVIYSSRWHYNSNLGKE